MTQVTFCRRCGGSVICEPFTDNSGSGIRSFCLSCSDDEHHYSKKLPSGLTKREINDLMRSGPRARPRKVRT